MKELAHYAERQTRPLADPRQLESSINDAGCQLLGAGRTADAIAVLELNVRLFPEACNAWDRLGEALMQNGEREAAIEHYEKSLELNPENANAEAMLERPRALPAPTGP